MKLLLFLFVMLAASCIKAPRFEPGADTGQETTSLPFTPGFDTEPMRWGTVETGNLYSCAITGALELYCWGEEIGHQKTTDVGIDLHLIETDVFRLSVGPNHTCYVDSRMNLFCWGDNSEGQIEADLGPSLRSSTAGMDGENSGVIDVSVGTSHTCALYQNGAIKCIGTPVIENAENLDGLEVSSGNDYSLLLNRGVLLSFGEGSVGRLGRNDMDPAPKEVDLPSQNVVGFSAGESHGCAIIQGDQLYCWGSNVWRQLGTDAGATVAEVPIKVTGNSWVAVSGGEKHTCGIKEMNEIRETFCWGANLDLQVGVGGSSIDTPTVVPDVRDSGVISAGAFHTCALSRIGKLNCWGRAAQILSVDNSGIPVEITIPE